MLERDRGERDQDLPDGLGISASPFASIENSKPASCSRNGTLSTGSTGCSAGQGPSPQAIDDLLAFAMPDELRPLLESLTPNGRDALPR
jgi:hypothetical protein